MSLLLTSKQNTEYTSVSLSDNNLLQLLTQTMTPQVLTINILVYDLSSLPAAITSTFAITIYDTVRAHHIAVVQWTALNQHELLVMTVFVNDKRAVRHPIARV